MAQENIKLTKTIYSTKSTDGIVDRSFSEFFKTKDPVNVDRFFSIYGELFYDIPKTGKNSHTSVIKQSTDYIKNYIDPRDEQITLLTERIIELEEELNKPKEEHPFYSNGTLIAPPTNSDPNKPAGWSMYYMDRGKRRYIIGGDDGDVFKALKVALGFDSDAHINNIVKVVPGVILDGITEGPQLGIEDLTGLTNTLEIEKQLISETVVEDWEQELNTIDHEGTSMRFAITLRQLVIKNLQLEQTIESLSYKYYQDVQNGFTQEERDNGQILLDLNKLKELKIRQTLVVLKRITLAFPNIVKTGHGSIPSKDEIYNLLPETIITSTGKTEIIRSITEDELDTYSGWQKGFIFFNENLYKGIENDVYMSDGVTYGGVGTLSEHAT